VNRLYHSFRIVRTHATHYRLHITFFCERIRFNFLKKIPIFLTVAFKIQINIREYTIAALCKTVSTTVKKAHFLNTADQR